MGNDVQDYVDDDGWVYMDHLKSWTDAGMDTGDRSYIDACSGIVNRGCYNPPCGGNPMEGGAQRAANFAKVLKAMKIGAVFGSEDHQSHEETMMTWFEANKDHNLVV